ncbi:MAG: oligosaccharide flippase family protein [Anaerolineaceae bacterium]|nr:oligosaccharide flippase family protein [Anaerolineaceae bacterium]
MFELTQAFLFFLTAQISSIIFSFGRAKAIAAFCGVAGLGLVSQGTNLIATIQVFLGGGLTTGFVKLIAEHSKGDDPHKLNQVISSMFYFGTILGVAGVLFAGLFSNQISAYVFGDARYGSFVLICTVSACFVFQYMFFLNLFRGLLEWKIYSLTYIVGYIANLVVTVALIVIFNITGAIWALLASQVGNLLIALFIYQRIVKARHTVSFIRVKPTLAVMRLLVGIIGPLVIIQIITSLSNLVVSSLIIKQLGVDQNGIYRVASGISDGYMGLILAFQFSYVLPKIAGSVKKEPLVARKTQNDGLRMCLFVITPLLIVLLASREIWIPILYSRAFLAAQGILGLKFLGDFFLVIRRSLNIDLVPTNRLKYYTMDGLIFAGGMIIITALFLPTLHLTAVVVGGLVVNVLLMLTSFAYHLKRTDFRLSPESKLLLMKASVLFGAGFAAGLLIPNMLVRALIIAGILVLVLLFLPQKGELVGLLREAASAVNKPKKVAEVPHPVE